MGSLEMVDAQDGEENDNTSDGDSKTVTPDSTTVKQVFDAALTYEMKEGQDNVGNCFEHDIYCAHFFVESVDYTTMESNKSAERSLRALSRRVARASRFWRAWASFWGSIKLRRRVRAEIALDEHGARYIFVKP